MTETLEIRVLPKDPLLAERFDVQICNGFSLPSFSVKFLKERFNFRAREDDVYVVSYPKTGTTWLQEIVYLIHSNLNFGEAAKQGLDKRFPYIEHARTNFNFVEQMASPRLLKTHLPYSLLPLDILKKQCKLIYITRNPKDVVVSYYHFACILAETQYEGSFSQFFERFLLDRPTYSPFLKHTLEFWEHRKDQNVLFLAYEDLQKKSNTELAKYSTENSLTPIWADTTISNKHHTIAQILQTCDQQRHSRSNPRNIFHIYTVTEDRKSTKMNKNLPDVILRITEFLGKNLAEEDIQKVVEHCSFQSMSKNKNVGLQSESARDGKADQFFRRGKVGDWQNYFTEEQNHRMEEWIESQIQGSGLQFIYEL